MPVTYLLNGIGRKNSSGVYRFVIDVIPLKSCHENNDPSASEVPYRERSGHMNGPPRDIIGSVGGSTSTTRTRHWGGATERRASQV